MVIGPGDFLVASAGTRAALSEGGRQSNCSPHLRVLFDPPVALGCPFVALFESGRWPLCELVNNQRLRPTWCGSRQEGSRDDPGSAKRTEALLADGEIRSPGDDSRQPWPLESPEPIFLDLRHLCGMIAATAPRDPGPRPDSLSNSANHDAIQPRWPGPPESRSRFINHDIDVAPPQLAEVLPQSVGHGVCHIRCLHPPPARIPKLFRRPGP